LTDEQARQEACRRWGDWGQVWHLITAHGLHPGEPHCVVGHQEDDATSVVGRGETWKEVFANAEAQGH
jgi:hypothetical protein